jgi:Carboxypeptidase regulatory-like domain
MAGWARRLFTAGLRRWTLELQDAVEQIVGPEQREATFASSSIRRSYSVAPWPGQLRRSTPRTSEMKRLFSSLVVFAFCSGATLAQQPTGRLNGTVVDSLGAAISKVQITVTNSTASFSAASDENGKFHLDAPPGTYEIRSDKLPGFAATKRNITVAKNKTTKITIVPAVSLDDPHLVPGGPATKRPKRKRHHQSAASNKSLDASGGSVFRIIAGPAMLE